MIRTDRLRTEPLDARHASALFAGLKYETDYEFIIHRAPERIVGLEEWFLTRPAAEGRRCWRNWALWSRPTGGYVGWVKATGLSGRAGHTASVLFHEAVGHAFAREVVTALVEHLRGAWDARSILATVDARNPRAIALLSSLGFERGVVRTEAEKIQGRLPMKWIAESHLCERASLAPQRGSVQALQIG